VNAGPSNGSSASGSFLQPSSTVRAAARVPVSSGAHASFTESIVCEDGAVKGVKINRLGEDFEVRSKVVVGADGVESQVGRWGGINTTFKVRDIMSCAQYHMENVDILEETLDFYFGKRYSPSGYTWIFPKGERAANVGLGVQGSKLNAKRPIDYLNEFVADKFPDGNRSNSSWGAFPQAMRSRP
jgi:digeranylgeranylglycerophospholipid reductase